MSTISQSHTTTDFTALDPPPVYYSGGSLLATDGDEVKPRQSKWTCTLCHASMLSNDITAHTTGRRHMAALAKAGDAQSVPTAATTETEANPPIPPGMLVWTCTLCLKTMSSKDAAGHRNGKRHIAALIKAGNAQSGLVTATTVAEANPPSSPDKANWTCTICHSTMSLNDSTTHEKGKRHIKALAKIDNVESGPTATPSFQPNYPTPEPNAPFAAFAIGGPKTSRSSKSLPKAQKKRAHTTANTRQGIFPPRLPAYTDDWQRDQERYEYLYQSSPCNANIDNLDYSLCDSDCGWCGECNYSAYVTRAPSAPHVRSPLEDDKDPLAAFFAHYSPFKYNSFNPSHIEYQRLCAFSGWPSHKQEEHHDERDRAWGEFRIAMVKAFNFTFGDDENDMEAWGRMCELVRMKDIPDTLEARREAVIQTHVNLCDLLDSTRQRSRVRIFSSELELRLFTIRTGNFFPREHAYAGGLLKYLLREITGEYLGRRVQGGSRKKGKEASNGKGKSVRKK